MVSTKNEGPILAGKILERLYEIEIEEEDKRLIKDFIEAFYELEDELDTCITKYYLLKKGLKGLQSSYD
jgi:hypothetical protein